jgi:hypothetical protein
MKLRHWVLAPYKLDVPTVVGGVKSGDRGTMRHLKMFMPYDYSEHLA